MKSVWRHIGAVSALALSLGFGGMAHADTAPANTGTAAAIMQSTAALQAGKCDEALPFLAQLWDDAALQKADPDMAEQFRFQRVLCTLQTGGISAALTLSAENIHHDGASIASYDLHTFLLLSNKQVVDAASTLDEAMTRFPQTANKLTDMSVMATLLFQSDEAQRRALLAHLERVRWQVHDASARLVIDIMRLDGLRAAVTANDKPLADLYRTDIAGDALVYALIEGDGTLSDPDAPAIPITPVVQQQIQDVMAHVAGQPTDLMGFEYLLNLERSADQNQAALTQLNGMLNLIAANGLDKFQQPNLYPTLVGDKASLLLDLQKPAEAVQVFQEGTTRMQGAGITNFVLSYMDYLVSNGQEKDAFALESHLDFQNMSAGQKQELASIEACAYAYQKDASRYNLTLAATADESGVRALKPYLCAGDLDGAAAAMIARINNGDSRLLAIMMMQDGLPAIAHTDRDRAYIAALQAVKKRPDVIAAAKAQKIVVRSWPLRF